MSVGCPSLYDGMLSPWHSLICSVCCGKGTVCWHGGGSSCYTFLPGCGLDHRVVTSFASSVPCSSKFTLSEINIAVPAVLVFSVLWFLGYGLLSGFDVTWMQWAATGFTQPVRPHDFLGGELLWRILLISATEFSVVNPFICPLLFNYWPCLLHSFHLIP